MLFSVHILVAFLAFSAVSGQDAVTTTTSKPTTSTSATTTSTPTTTTTTTAATTTSTTTAATTTTKATTTTAAPTTPKPSTTTSKPKPTPPPIPAIETGNWNVTENGTQLCLKAQFGLVIVVPYETTDNRVVEGSVMVPPNALARGSCSSLQLMWAHQNDTTRTNYVNLNFTESTPVNKTKPDFVLTSATATLVPDADRFPDAVPTDVYQVTLKGYGAFEAPVNNSFRCYSEQRLQANMTVPEVKNNGTVVNGVFLFKDVQVQPYVPKTSTGFSAAVSCPLDRELTSDIVPIAVGCALAGLVVVVIVAYIIGRRRSRQSGYTSV